MKFRSDIGLPARSEWSEADLDAALQVLFSAAQVGRQPATTNQHSRTGSKAISTPTAVVIGRQPRSRRRHRTRPAWLVAIVAVAVAGALIASSFLASNGPRVDATVAAELNAAADAATRAAAAGDDVIPEGRYRYIETLAWGVGMSGDLAVRQQGLAQSWMPADWHDTWLDRMTDTGIRQWIAGSEADAAAMGLGPEGVVKAEPDKTGPCRDYFYDVCAGVGSWQAPTRPWIDALPTEPLGMYDRLRGDSVGYGMSDEAEMLVQATDALRTGLLSATVRATLYRAMAMIHGIQMTDRAVNLDGRIGIGFAVTNANSRDETIIDAQTGAYIGERSVSVNDHVASIPPGTVLSYSSTTSAIVDELGSVR